MPEFCDPFVVLNADRKMTHEELVRLIRLAIASEYETVQIYSQIIEATRNDDAKKVFTDAMDDEKVHAGKFLRLMKEIQPDEFEYYDKGAKEVEALLKK